jgi:endonuclease III
MNKEILNYIPFTRMARKGIRLEYPTRYVSPYWEHVSVEVYPLSYDNIISSIMNSLYPSDKVQALTANYNEARDDEELSKEKRKEYIDEYHAYQAKRKEIKALAKEIMREVTHGQV